MEYSSRKSLILNSALFALMAISFGERVRGDVEGGTDTAYGNASFASGQGNYNTVFGSFTLWQNQTGGDGNTALGYTSMYWNTTGIGNTATGNQSLNQNRTGYWNTATGFNSLISNTTGNNNTASGIDALACNFTGSWNTASGAFALGGGTFNFVEPFPQCAAGHAYFGNGNTASGGQALLSNTIGNNNTASGYLALESNIDGDGNTAAGYQSLYSNTSGNRNAASGSWGLYSNTTGSNNTAAGQDALYSVTTGSNNIGLGANAGYYATTGGNNIEIGNQGTSKDNAMIRIGAAGSQTATYIAGIANTQVTGSAVYVTSAGQLGVLASSERYKTSIAPMGAGTEKLQRLRPVSFHLKTDPHGAVQYGLIAEEVDKVYPELVIRDDAGKIQGVRYDELAPMLLNEMQRQAAEIRYLKNVQQRAAAQAQQLQDLQQRMADVQAALSKLQPRDELLAQRR